MFDWLATGGVLPFNPASAVRGPKHVVKRGKTSVLAPDEARAILDAIYVSTPIGLRDRALIGLMVYTFARISAATAMRVEERVRAEPPPVGAAAREGRQGGGPTLSPQRGNPPARLPGRDRYRRGR